MMNGKQEPKDLAIETINLLYAQRAKAEIMLGSNGNYEERRLLERLIDAIERSKDDLRRNCTSHS